MHRRAQKSALRSQKIENETQELNTDYTENFRRLHKRFNHEKHIYQEASVRYKRIDFWAFTMPLLILQICNAIIPVFLSSEDGTLNKQIATTIAAISAAVMGLQAKMRMGAVGEKYSA